jgi:hypothetical protein
LREEASRLGAALRSDVDLLTGESIAGVASQLQPSARMNARFAVLAALFCAASCGMYPNSPATPAGLVGVHARAIANGGDTVCAETDEGTVKCVRVGLDDDPRTVYTAAGPLVTGPRRSLKIHDLTFSITETGNLRCHADQGDVEMPLDGARATGLEVGPVEVYRGDVCAVLEVGTVRCWPYQQVNTPPGKHSCVVQASADVPNLSGVTQFMMAGGTRCALTNGQAKCWGSNNNGQTGTGLSDAEVLEPTLVVDEKGRALHDIASIDLGWSRGCAVISNGDLDCWGVDVLDARPHAARGWFKHIRQVSLGTSAIDAALLEDGSVMVWGGSHWVGPTLDIGPGVPLALVSPPSPGASLRAAERPARA